MRYVAQWVRASPHWQMWSHRNQHQLATTAPKVSPADRCGAYLEKVPPSISGDRGHNRLFHAAMVIVDRFAVQDHDTAYGFLAEFNEKGDPEDERQLHHKLESAFNAVDKQGGPSRDLLNEDAAPRSTRSRPHRLSASPTTRTTIPARQSEPTSKSISGPRYW